MRDHPEALEADIQRVYGIDLGGLWRGELSVRRLVVLVRYLPPDAAVWSEQSGVDFGWSLTDYLLADLFHVLAREPHPARPSPKRDKKRDAGRLAAALLAQRERLGVSQ